MLFITEKLQNQSLEDVNFPALLEKIPYQSSLPYQYQTRSKTRALQQTLQDTLLQDNGLHNWCSTSTQSSFLSSIFNQSSTSISTTSTVSATTTSSSSSSSSTSTSRSIPIVEQYNNALNESISTTPPAPPKKRHCRSLSAGEVNEGRSSRWKPNVSKVWRPIRQCRAKVDAYNGHAPMLNQGSSCSSGYNNNLSDFHKDSAACMSIPSTMLNLAAGDSGDSMMNQYSTPPESPVPRPASATSWENSTNPPGWLEQTSFKPLSSPWLWHRLRSLEDTGNEGFSASSGSVASLTSSVDSAPEIVDLTSSCGLARGTYKQAMAMMPRCKSQPCVSRRKKCGKKRRREEEPRPNLDLFKMREESRECLRHPSTDQPKQDSQIEPSRHRRTGCHKYQNKKHLRSSGMTSAYPPEEFVGLTTIASSPCENNNLPPPATFQPSSTPSSTQQRLQQQQQQQNHENKQAPHWSVMITPTSSPTKDLENVTKKRPDEDFNENMCSSYCSDDDLHPDHHHDEDEDDDDDSDADTMIDRSSDRFVLDPCNELDLEQIEKY